MTEAQVIALIQQWIVANGNNEITADVLRPILEAMVQQPNDLIGDLDSLDTTDKTDLVAAINSALSQSGGGVTEIFRGFTSGTGTLQAQAAASINAGAAFTIPKGHIGAVSFVAGESFSGSTGGDYTKVTFFIKTGAGTYGSGGTTLTGSQLLEFAPVNVGVGASQIFELGDIGASTIEDFVNGSGPYVISGLAVFKATQSGTDKVWLFTGGNGTFGDGATVVNAGMFVDLTAQDPIPSTGVQYLEYKTITTTPYTLDWIDLNRLLVFTSNNQVVNIPTTLVSDAEAQGLLSYWFRAIFRGTGTHTVVDPELAELDFLQDSYIMAECYDVAGDTNWIIKQFVNKTSDLENDGDGTNPFATTAQIPTQTVLNTAYTESLPIVGLTPPTEFNDQLNLQRIYDGEKVRYLQDPYEKIDFEITETPTNYYVSYISGNDANDGLTEGTAWKTITYAVANAVSPAVINFMDEWMGYLGKAVSNLDVTGKYKFKSVHPSGKTMITSMREVYTKATFNWFDEGGGVWSTSAATTTSTIFNILGRIVFDARYKDERGGAMPVPDVGSQAACAATPGSQYHDSVNEIKYVHLIDGREPDPFDGFIYAFQSFNWAVRQNADDGVVLIEDLEFYHNAGMSDLAGCRYRHVTTATNNSIYGIKNCISYGSSGNGFEVYDAKISVIKNCWSKYQRKDGHNYHSFQTTGIKGEYMTIYEVDSGAIYQGYDGFTNQPALGDSNNATTAHDSIHIERINGNYGEGRGATVADVNGCVSVLWNCNAGPSKGGTFQSCYWAENLVKAGVNFGMWLWGCKAHDDDDAAVRLLNNEAQSGGTANDGQLYVKYWRGKTDGTVTGTLKDWDGNIIT